MPSRPSADQARLSIINEDSDVLPSTPSNPPTASHRPFSRRWRDQPPAANYDLSPPKYSVWDVSGPRGEKLMDMRNNKYLVRRGGWKRLCIIFLVVAAVAIALGVGLGVGLQRRRGDRGGNVAESPIQDSNRTEPFPLGSYDLYANLDLVRTDCTENSATWSCFPLVQYDQSPSESGVSLHWLISGSPDELNISSIANPFAINFSNITLSLEDAGDEDERYTFSLLLNKQVFPNVSLTGDDRRAVCFFNDTRITGTLYTRRTSTRSNDTVIMSNATVPAGRAIWPGSIEFEQTISGGQSVPDCYVQDDGNLLSPVTDNLSPQPTQYTCACRWRNFG